MTPGARLAAAMAVLDAALHGTPLEKALTGWARGSRFAGAKDRAAVRDLAYDAWRCRRSFAALGGAETGRGLILGGLRAAGTDPAGLMTGEGYAPPPPQPDESGRPPEPGAEAADLPDWLWPVIGRDSADAAAYGQVLRSRAPVFARVNLARTDIAAAIAALVADDIEARPLAQVKTALEITGNARKIGLSRAFLDGLVDLQDAASQAAVLALPIKDGDRVLDYCAGGGGKSLAMAARASIRSFAHDAVPARMADLAPRAARAAITVTEIPTAALATTAPFDLVLVDAPCSGSGTWRRDPEGKWRLTPARLAELVAIQAEILDAAQSLVTTGGFLAYATCSVLRVETADQISDFLRAHPDWIMRTANQWQPGPEGDGFSLTVLQRAAR